MDDVQRLVLVVDDDESVRRSLRWLLITAGYQVATFDCGTDFLEHGTTGNAACLLLDVRMPDMTGLEVKTALIQSGRDIATVFVTGSDDVTTSVQAMKAGAEDFLLKPVEEEAHEPPQKAAGEIIEDEDTNETVERIVAWLDERKLI